VRKKGNKFEKFKYRVLLTVFNVFRGY